MINARPPSNTIDHAATFIFELKTIDRAQNLLLSAPVADILALLLVVSLASSHHKSFVISCATARRPETLNEPLELALGVCLRLYL